MKKTLSYGLKSFLIAWEANSFLSLVEIISKVYDSTLYPFVQVLLLARFLDLISQKVSIGFDDVFGIILIYVLASILKFILKTFVDVRGPFHQTKMEGVIDLKIVNKMSELDPATFEGSDFQDLIAQLEGIKGSIQMHLLRFTGLVDAVFKFITATLVVSATFPLFAPIVLIATIPAYIAWDRFRIKTWPFYVEKKSKVGRVTQYVKDLLSQNSTSKETAIFQTGPVLYKKVEKEQKKYYFDFAHTNDPWIINILLGKLVQFAAFIYTQYMNLSKVFSGVLSVGQFTLVFQQSLNLTFSAEEILNQYSSISARNKYLDNFFNFLNQDTIIKSPNNPQTIPAKPTPPIITFKDVSFKYPGTRRFILKNFNLTIQGGEKVALVGENGAGKTTIIKLLLRFYDVTDGEILINGVDIRKVDLKKWHKQIGALFQDFIKYQFTFKENVYFGDLTKENQEKTLKAAIDKSGASKYLSTLPKGIDQVVGKMFEGGIDLSGGQWQKLALARAFFRNAPLLVLDEPTSAIDAKAEYEIFENVQKLEKDKTVVIISHRFSTVRNADRILVLDNGKIIEEGNHQSLMEKDGLYAELFNLQAKGYK